MKTRKIRHTIPTPPVAAKRPVSETIHGDVRVDDYGWMRDKKDAGVIAYLESENAYTEAMTAHTKPLVNTLYKEILGRIKETDQQVPVRDSGWFYYARTTKGKPYPIYCRRRTLRGKEQIILDQNKEAKPFTFHQIGGMEVSPDGNYLAALVDTNGYEDFVLRIRDLRTGKWLADTATELSWGLAWASDSKTIFYVRGDTAKRPDRVFRHSIGMAADALVFHEPNVLFNVHIQRTRSGAFVMIQSGSYSQDEWRAIDAAAPESEPFLIAPRAEKVEYTVEHGGRWFYIVTNRDGATNFKVMRAPVDAPSEWREFIRHKRDAFVEGVDVFAKWIVRTERREGLRRIVIRTTTAAKEYDVSFPDPAYGVDLDANPEFDSTVLRFTYSSFVVPPSVYDFDMRTRRRTLMKRQPVLGGYRASRYKVERLMVSSRDGSVRIPVSLVYKAPLRRDGKRPLVLYAYGSYGATMEPTFSAARFSLVDRGFVYAIAHVRGGQEMGRHWYDDGKMMNKLHTFEDFIDVAAHLSEHKYTNPEHLVAHGGSAGGLLMGAIANMRPDLFGAIVADVPFVDVINTMLDATIPLTAQEWEQWGNPQNADAYRYMLRYSPYDNVTAQKYPRMLVLSGINDSRVAFWEPAKWVARLRALKTDANPLLLQMLMGAGHGGSSGRYDRIRETAFRYAFMIDSVE